MAGTDPVRVTHTVALNTGVSAAWRALVDGDLVAACLPDVSFGARSNGTARGKLKVRLGSVNPTFQGTGEVVERNGRAHRVVVALSGEDVRGSGSIAATVTATVRRAADTTVLRVEADVELTGRPAQVSNARQQAAVTQLIEQFTERFIATNSEGDVVADQPAGNSSAEAGDGVPAPIEGSAPQPPEPDDSSAPRKRPRPKPNVADDARDADDAPIAADAPIGASAPQPPEQPLDDPSAVEAGPDLPPDDSDEQPVEESAMESAADVSPPAEPAAAAAAAPSFGTPGGIPVPELGDEPSVNGHSHPGSGPAPRHSDEKSPLATSTRQAMAKRVAPVALGIVFVLAAARRRRGKSA